MARTKLRRAPQKEQYIQIKDDYRTAHESQLASTREMIEWAVDTGKYRLDLQAAMKLACAEMTDALRAEYISDDRGRRVRVNHSIQGNLWDDIRTIRRGNMELSIGHRRNNMVGEAKQLKTDLNFYNELHADEPPLQTSFNFDGDLMDLGLLGDEERAADSLTRAVVRADAPEPAEQQDTLIPGARLKRTRSKPKEKRHDDGKESEPPAP